jgi:quercetin dioxygenase-like cupin family protein
VADETFAAFDALRPYAVWPGVVARAVHGRELTLALVDLEPDAVVAEHRHVNEQLGFVVRGGLRFTIGGETRDLVAGDSYVIPSDVPHDALAGPEGATVVDVFAPPRADWEKAPRLAPAPGAWPGKR